MKMLSQRVRIILMLGLHHQMMMIKFLLDKLLLGTKKYKGRRLQNRPFLLQHLHR